MPLHDPAFTPPAGQLHELIGSIYDGVLETPPWASMLGQLRQAFQATWTALIVRPPMNGALAQIVNSGPQGIGFAPDRLRTEASFNLDPMARLPEMRMSTMDEVMEGRNWLDVESLKHLQIANDCRYVLGANVHTSEGISGRLRICRGLADRDFDDAEKAFGNLLLPHLNRAFEMHQRLTANESESRLYNLTVDRMLVGTVVLDMQGAIQRVNDVASSILTDSDGLRLMHGRLRAYYQEEDRELQAMIRHALANAQAGRIASEQSMAVTRPTGSAKLSIVVRSSPIAEWSQAQRQSAVLVLVGDPSKRTQVSTETLRKHYGLTIAEAQLCIHLIEGLALDESAERMGIRKNTARAHLRAIFSKTQVTRQSALVSLLMAGPAGYEF